MKNNYKFSIKCLSKKIQENENLEFLFIKGKFYLEFNFANFFLSKSDTKQNCLKIDIIFLIDFCQINL